MNTTLPMDILDDFQVVIAQMLRNENTFKSCKYYRSPGNRNVNYTFSCKQLASGPSPQSFLIL